MRATRPAPREPAQLTWGLRVGKDVRPTPGGPAAGGWVRRAALGLLLLGVYWLLSHGCHNHDEDTELRAARTTGGSPGAFPWPRAARLWALPATTGEPPAATDVTGAAPGWAPVDRRSGTC